MKKIEKQFQEYLDYCRNIRFQSVQTIRGKKWTLANFIKETNIQEAKEINEQIIMQCIARQKRQARFPCPGDPSA